MIRRPPVTTREDTLLPVPTLFRSDDRLSPRGGPLSAVARNPAAGECGPRSRGARSRAEGRSVMFETLSRHPLCLLVGTVALLVILSQTLAIVPEDKQALILRFGEIERTVNRYNPKESFGHSGAGLVVRVPVGRASVRERGG